MLLTQSIWHLHAVWAKPGPDGGPPWAVARTDARRTSCDDRCADNRARTTGAKREHKVGNQQRRVLRWAARAIPLESWSQVATVAAPAEVLERYAQI